MKITKLGWPRRRGTYPHYDPQTGVGAGDGLEFEARGFDAAQWTGQQGPPMMFDPTTGSFRPAHSHPGPHNAAPVPPRFDPHLDPRLDPHVGQGIGPELATEPGAQFATEVGAEVGAGSGVGGVDPGLVAALDHDVDEWFSGAAPAGRKRAWLPEYLEVAPRHVAVGAELAACLVIVGYPREVHPGWLEPLTSYPARVDVSVHIEPVPPQVASARLRRQLARMESSRYGDAQDGRLADPHLDAAAADAYELAGRVARSETRLFRVALSLLVRASHPQELAEQVDAVSSLAASMLLDARPTSYRALPGWVGAQPWGIEPLGQRRTMDTDCLAAAFPFAASELPSDPVRLTPPGGVLYGRNLSGPGLVFWDRWAQPNHNSVNLAESGFGKSYLTKLEIIRGLYTGIHALGIDPENEYAALTAALGGTYIRLGEPGIRINPLDLPQPTTPNQHPTQPAGPTGATDNPAVSGVSDVLTRRQLYTHTVLAVLFGQPLDPEQRAVADRGICACYQAAGITHDPGTWSRPAPLLADLATTLAHLEDTDGIGRALAARLQPFTTGSFSGLFNGPTTYPDATNTHLVVFSLRSLPDELKPIGTLLALDAIWRTVSDATDWRRRLVFVDEGWILLQNPAGAQFLFRLGKSARKRRAALALATQDAPDVLATDLGRAVVANSATRILMRTAPQAADQVHTAFGLSDGEIAYLTTAEVGAGLLVASRRHRVAFRAQASAEEHALVTTDPAELAEFAGAHQPQPPNTSPGGYPGSYGANGAYLWAYPARAATSDNDPAGAGTAGPIAYGHRPPAASHPPTSSEQPRPSQPAEVFEDDPL